MSRVEYLAAFGVPTDPAEQLCPQLADKLFGQ